MRPEPDTVMLFAAGLGTRMGDLTKTQPKPLIKVAGKALIDHALDQIEGFGTDRILCNLHYLPDQIETHLQGRDIGFSHETPQILDTGGGLKFALPKLARDTVFTMNTDAVWQGPNALQQLADAWDPDRMDALLLCVAKENAIGHVGTGDFRIDHNNKAARGSGDIYTGLQIIKTTGLADIEDRIFSLNLIWDQMIMSGRLHAIRYPGKWCDVGTPEGFSLAESFLAEPHD